MNECLEENEEKRKKKKVRKKIKKEWWMLKIGRNETKIVRKNKRNIKEV